MITTEINKTMKLSEHFTLGELTKTSYHTMDGNIPSRVAIENLQCICEGWRGYCSTSQMVRKEISMNSFWRSEARLIGSTSP